MEGLNPGEMGGSFDIVDFAHGEIEINASKYELQSLNKFMIDKFEKKEILEKVINYNLSDKINEFIKDYDRVCGERNIFIWKFLGCVFSETGVTLSTVDKKLFDSNIDCKLITSILCCILDDVAEARNDKELLREMSNVFSSDSILGKTGENEKVRLVKKLWRSLLNELRKYPKYDEYIDIFLFDVKQMLNAIEYSYLVNNNKNISNVIEMSNYDCHNMIVYLLNGIDIMSSSNIDKKDLSQLRTVFWHSQQMTRIGNWLSTWKRELKEKDFSSGVFAYVFSNRILDIDSLDDYSNEEIFEKIENSDVYSYFLKIWQENFEKLIGLKDKIFSVDMNQYISGLEKVMRFHMASEGLK